jgi:plastocyanin
MAIGRAAWILAVVLLTPSVAVAADLAGRAVFHGAPHANARRAVLRDRRACGASQIDESLVVSSSGGIANVVLSALDVSGGTAAASAPAVLVNQVGCRFVPHVLAVRTGQRVAFGNADPVLHNIHAYRGEETLFNLGFPLQGQRHEKTFDEAGTVELRCDAGHDWMHGYVVVFDHPFFAVTGSDGRFAIPSMPAGKHRLRAWHEKLGTKELEVEIKPSGETTVEIDWP